MGGISGSLGYYLIGVQPSQGTVATSWYRFRAQAEPSWEPMKTVKRYTMTDTGRDQGDAYVSVVAAKGDLAVYLHPDGASLLAYLALGTNADSGADPNYVHTETPADDVPWFSIFRVVGGVITEQFVDCKLDTLKVESTAGEPLVATLSPIGITPTWETVPVTGITVVSAAPYMHYDAKANFKIATVAQAVDKWTWEFKNNLLDYQADDYFLNDIAPGKRVLDFSFGMHFTGATAEPDYRAFMYGSDAGTTISTALPTKAVDFKFAKDANTSIEFSMPQVRYSAVPVEPNPDGTPIEVEVATEVEVASGSPLCTVTVKDQITTPGA